MEPGQRNEYLKALGIDVWIPRKVEVPDTQAALPARQEPRTGTLPGTSPASFVIGPGNGNTLLLCGSAAEAATALAADIARCLDCEPVWGWPAQSPAEQGIGLKQAIEERLFTRLLVFGPGLADDGREAASPAIRSARRIQADPMTELLTSGPARQKLWHQLSANNWCATTARIEQ